MAGPSDLTRILARARLLALDVDGTLTDGRVVYVGGDELLSFCVRDGQGLAWLRQVGIEVAWITGRGCRATERRAEELGVRELFLGAGPKAEVLRGIQERLGVGVGETVAMGDDLPDLGLARRAALFAAPADAHELVRERAEIVTRSPGGFGAVRELCEGILRAKGRWKETIGRYREAAP